MNFLNSIEAVQNLKYSLTIGSEDSYSIQKTDIKFLIKSQLSPFLGLGIPTHTKVKVFNIFLSVLKDKLNTCVTMRRKVSLKCFCSQKHRGRVWNIFLQMYLLLGPP